MKRRLAALTMAFVLGASISCMCAASDTADTDISETVVQETASSDENESTDPILSDENIDKLYALVAYNINHEYLEPNDMAKVQFKWPTDIAEWVLIERSLRLALTDDGNLKLGSSFIGGDGGNLLNSKDNLDLINIIYTSLYKTYKQYFSEYDDSTFSRELWKDNLPQNVTFSADQLELGEEISQEIDEAGIE